MDKFPDRTIPLDTVVQWIVTHERQEDDPIDTLMDLVTDFAQESAFAPRSTRLTANGAFEVLEAYLEDGSLAHSAVAAMLADDAAAATPSSTVTDDDIPGVELAAIVDEIVKLKNPRKSKDTVWFETMQMLVAMLPRHAFTPTVVTRVAPRVTARSIIDLASDGELDDRYLAGVSVAVLQYLLSESRDS